MQVSTVPSDGVCGNGRSDDCCSTFVSFNIVLLTAVSWRGGGAGLCCVFGAMDDGGWGDNFVRGLVPRGKIRQGKFPPPLQIPKVTLPHAHTVLPKPQISPGVNFAPFLKDEIIRARNYPPTSA